VPSKYAFLQRLAVGSSVDVFLRVSKFKLPKQLNCPVIMMGVVQHPHIDGRFLLCACSSPAVQGQA
jgi:hypothetical protein